MVKPSQLREQPSFLTVDSLLLEDVPLFFRNQRPAIVLEVMLIVRIENEEAVRTDEFFGEDPVRTRRGGVSRVGDPTFASFEELEGDGELGSREDGQAEYIFGKGRKSGNCKSPKDGCLTYGSS
jgi:hypothetical protein